jgi:hypothetical protein
MMSEVEDMLFSEYVTSAATRCLSANAGSATANAALLLENMASHEGWLLRKQLGKILSSY